MGEAAGGKKRRARVAGLVAAVVVGACAVAWASSRRLHASRSSDALLERSSEPAPSVALPAPAPKAPLLTPRETTLHVPRVAGPVVINAETESKRTWDADTGTTRNLLDAEGHGMVPYTEAKIRWGNDKLYLLLYAGDLDLEGRTQKHDGAFDKDDSFRLEFPSRDAVRVVEISVLGTVSDFVCPRGDAGAKCDPRWESRAEVAVDRDGTLNKVGDNDEEWVVEMAIPLSSLGLLHAKPGMTIPFSVGRCEMGHDGVHACGSWGTGTPAGELVLEP
jgi:hypothetical protein